MSQGMHITAPLENGNLPMIRQDQTTPPLDALFAQSVSNFSLSAPTGVSGVAPATFVYVFNAVAAHGIAPGDEILLLDAAANRSFFAVVTTVVTNVITVDRPIDHDFTTLSLGRIVTTEMAVNGAGVGNEQEFSIRAGDVPSDSVRFILTALGTAAMDDGKFGDIAALTRGFVFRIVNSFQRTIFCFKTNGEIAQFCFDVGYPSKAPAGQTSVRARISFGGEDKHGIVLRIKEDDVIQWVVQDDLTGMVSLKASAQGHDTAGEEVS